MATFIVDTILDTGADQSVTGNLALEQADGDGLSLREAVLLSNQTIAADTIRFDASLAGQTIVLAGGAMTITEDLTIDGDIGSDEKADISISGDDASRIFVIADTTTDASLMSLTLTNGATTGGGAAIFADNVSSLSIAYLTASGNVAQGQGGALLASGTTTTIVNSTFLSNQAGAGGALAVDGASAGGVTLTNVTVYGNQATTDGGIHIGGGADVTLNNSTVSRNDISPEPRGVSEIGNDGGTLTLNNTVVATVSNIDDESIDGQVTLARNNFIGRTSTIVTNDGSVNGSGEDPLLRPLADNGGPVMTLGVYAGSVLIDGGSNAAVPPGVVTDANGDARIQDGIVDIGATEIAAGSEPGSTVVTTAADVVDPFDQLTSLREAVAFANSDPDDSVITFDASLARLIHRGPDFGMAGVA